MNNQPIGIFDSGLGGLSVWQEIIKILPHESMIYFADQKNCPYGERTPQEITQFSSQIVDFFLKRNCKIVVVACNTATSASIYELRKKYKLPFVGMEPAVKPAAMLTKTGKVGVIATKGTLSGSRFHEIKNKYAQDVEVLVQIGHGLVECIEAGEWDSPQTEKLLKSYLEPMLNKGIDQLVLGCTHYPFLKEAIQHITKGNVNIINPAIAVAKQTKRLLEENGLLHENEERSPSYAFYSSKDVKEIKHLLHQITPNLVINTMEVMNLE